MFIPGTRPFSSKNTSADHIELIVPAAGLQAFETPHQAFNPASVWSELTHAVTNTRMELDELSLSMPFEIAYARALGLPSEPGKIPWAAWHTQTLGQPCAWVYPCRLDVGMTDMVLQPVERLQLDDAYSQALHALIAPYLAHDGLALHYHSAARWLATGAPLADLPCASLARAQGQSINAFFPDAGQSPAQTQLARLQAEVQMLLYTHPLNDTRAAQGLPAVNSLWIDGAGQLDHMSTPTSTRLHTVKLDTRLQNAAHDPQAYAQAWRSLLEECQQYREPIAAGKFFLSLCGETCALRLQIRPSSTWQSLVTSFKKKIGQSPGNNLRSLL
jgi:hypothetical protein